MPRRARLKVSGQPWHIWQRGVNRSRCFSGIADRKLYLELLSEFAPRHECQLHAYALMPNHVHLLLTPDNDHSASRMMKAVGERYVRAFNKRHKRTGTLWEGRFKSSIVESDRYLFTLYRYIEMNPVRAGLVAHPAQYPWSSYLANAEGAESALITPHPQYLAMAESFQDRRDAYRAMFAQDLPAEDLREIRDAITGGFALGSAVLHGLLESHTGMRSQRKRRRAVEAPEKCVPI